MDVYLKLASEYHIALFKHNDSRWIDIGKPGQTREAEKMFPDLMI